MEKRVVATMVVSMLLLLGYGIVTLRHGTGVLRDSRVTCGGHVMKPGDTCTYPDDDSDTPTKHDYPGMRTDHTVEGYVFTVVGILAVGAATVAGLVLGFARRRLIGWVEALQARRGNAGTG